MGTWEKPCSCCRRVNVRDGTSSRPNGICSKCEFHQGITGSKLRQRDEDHLRFWRELTTELQVEIMRQKTAAADMQDELDARPVRVVIENLDMKRVEAAVADRDKAYQSRDRAYSLLSGAVMLHQEAKTGLCVCGTPFRKCEVGQHLEEEGRGLRDWESKQRQRMEDGQSHWLPANHPFVLDQRRRAAWAHERAVSAVEPPYE